MNMTRLWNWIELNLFAFHESKTGQYLGYRTSQQNITNMQQQLLQ
jgi:hypothetical protein